MPVFSKPTIASASFLLDFLQPVPEIKSHQALAEDVFSDFANASLQMTPYPDNADPSAPRMVFQTNRKSVLISQARCQLDFSFSENSSGFAKQLAIFQKNSEEFYLLATQKFKVCDYGLSAAMLDINYRSNSSNEETHGYLVERFVKSTLNYPVASIQLAIGFKVDDYYVNVSSQVYERRSFEVKQNSNMKPEKLHVRLEDMNLDERGISFKLDVNNRPLLTGGQFKLADDAQQTLGKLNNFLINDFNTLTGLNLYD